jgi:hypothetical protein
MALCDVTNSLKRYLCGVGPIHFRPALFPIIHKNRAEEKENYERHNEHKRSEADKKPPTYVGPCQKHYWHCIWRKYRVQNISCCDATNVQKSDSAPQEHVCPGKKQGKFLGRYSSSITHLSSFQPQH